MSPLFDRSASLASGKTVALYYPHIHFRSRRWLRVAALYYDNLARIVPDGLNADSPKFYQDIFVSPKEADAVLRDIEGLKSHGFLTDTRPESHVAGIADEFYDFAMANLVDPVRRAATFPLLAKRKQFYTIHSAKIDPTLRMVLKELELVHKKENDDYSDIEIEPATGALYMLFLANRMAGERQIVSDSPVFQSLLYQPVRGSGQEGSRTDLEFRLASAVMEMIIPDRIEEASLETLLDVRTEFAEHRQRFQRKIGALADNLRTASNENDITGEISEYAQELTDAYEDMRGRMTSLNLGLAYGLLCASVPSYVPSTWGLGVTSSVALGAVAAVAVSTLTMKYVSERRAVTATNPLSYVMTLNSRLPSRMARDIVTLNLTPADDGDRRYLSWLT